MTEQPAGAGAECLAKRDFALAAQLSRKREIGEVRERDEQDEARRGEEREKQRPRLGCQLFI